MCNKQLPRRSLAELDTVIEEIIQRNPKEYQELLDLIQEKMEHAQRKNSSSAS